MNFSLLFSFKSVDWKHKRTQLTLLAIAVGMLSLVLLTGLANGLNKDISEKTNLLGDDLIFVMPIQSSMNLMVAGHQAQFLSFTTHFYESDIRKLLLLGGVKEATGTIFSRANVKINDKEKNSAIAGIDKKYVLMIPSFEIEEGRWFKGKGEVVLGGRISEDFDENIRVGEPIKINNKTFRVVGILKESGNALAHIDDVFFIDKGAARDLFSKEFEKNEVSAISVKVADGWDSDEVAQEVQKKLEEIKHVANKKNKGFTVISPKFIQEQSSQITGAVLVFFLVVAAISLLVGIISVGNTLYMNVIDKTREIGLLKALGCKKKCVLQVYLIEAAIYVAVGGAIGAVAGYLLGKLQPFLTFILDLRLTIGGFVVVLILAMFAAYMPAKRAANISPTEALHYE